MKLKYTLYLAIPAAIALAWYALDKPSTLAEQRQYFIQAEQAIAKRDAKAFQSHIKKLTTYPLYPYLQYQWLKTRLDDSNKVEEFLQNHPHSLFAKLLRSKWLAKLAQGGEWQTFLDNYQETDNQELQCWFYWGKAETGQREWALDKAQALWVQGWRHNGCIPLFDALVKSNVMEPELVWQRFSQAIKVNDLNTANQAIGLMDAETQVKAQRWWQLQQSLELIQQKTWLDALDKADGELFVYGIDKLASKNLEAAVNLWDHNKNNFSVDDATLQRLERRLALSLAMRRDHRGFSRLLALNQFDDEATLWLLRSALFKSNWQGIIEAYSKIPLIAQQDAHWQYWLARAYAETGQAGKAQDIYTQAAKDRSFWGFLAADRIGLPYQFNDKPIGLGDDALKPLRQNTDLPAFEELIALKRGSEARHYWPEFLKQLDKGQLALAAKLAERWQWPQTAIITLTKADYWDDLVLRFPVAFQNDVEQNAAQQQLEPALVYGLMRQESMMDPKALSLVGAKGLMQLMPYTGRQVAKAFNETLQSEQDLFKPALNIKYGSHYFKQLVNQFNGHVALAIASYNAGPNKAKAWQPKDKPMPVDLWVELIPFKETRKYVSSVLAYTVVYQYRLNKPAFRLNKLLPDIPVAKN